MSIRATKLSDNYVTVREESSIALPVLLKPEKDPSWRESAKCKGEDRPDFFDSHYWKRAVQVCRGCSVRQRCLDFAIENDIRDGIWGGMTSRQRAAYVEAMA